MTKKEFLELYAHMSCVSLLFDRDNDKINDLNRRISDCIVKYYTSSSNEAYEPLEPQDFKLETDIVQKLIKDHVDDLWQIRPITNKIFNQ